MPNAESNRELKMSGERTAVLLIAHGSRRKEANDDLVRLAEMVRARNEYDVVEIAYLEVVVPTIPDGGWACVASGATRVLMLPFFLSAGSHVTEDLERHRREMEDEYAPVRFELCKPLGLHPQLVDVVFARLGEGSRATP